MKKLGNLIRCQNRNCGFRPFVGSPLEQDLSLLLISFVETLIPFQLLSWEHYKVYYERVVSPSLIVGEVINQQDRPKSYKTGRWKIHAMQFQILLMVLFGEGRHTRYLHGVVSCGEVWMDIAYALQDTPRNLFGNDGMETTNDVIKSTLRRNTGRFGFIDGSARTITSIMQWHFWRRYKFRETSSTRNTQSAAALNRMKHRKADRRLLQQPDQLRRQFMSQGIRYAPNYNNLNRRVQDDGFYDLIFHLNRDRAQHRQRSAVNPDDIGSIDWTLLNAVAPDSDTSSVDESSDDEAQEAQGNLTQEYTNLSSVYMGVSQNSNRRDSYSQDPFGLWKSCSMGIGADDNSRLFFGRFRLKLEGFFKRSDNDQLFDHVRIEWPYSVVRGLCVTSRQSTAVEVYIKTTESPKMEIAIDGGWQLVVEITNSFVECLMHCGKFRITLPDSSDGATWQAIREMIKYHSSIYAAHIQNAAGFWTSTPNGFSRQEHEAAKKIFEKMISPLHTNHNDLHQSIVNLFEDMSGGGRRRCANCKKWIGWYQKHASCFLKDDHSRNVSSNLFHRMTPDPSQLRIVEHPDPYQSIDAGNDLADLMESDVAGKCFATIVIDQWPDLWSRFVVLVHQRMVAWMVQKRKGILFKVRQDSDWLKVLNFHASVLMHHMDRAMEESMQQIKNLPTFEDFDSFTRHLFAAISGMFKLSESYRRRLIAAGPDRELVDSLHNDQAIFGWNHYRMIQQIGTVFASDWCMVQWACHHVFYFRPLERWRSWTHYLEWQASQ